MWQIGLRPSQLKSASPRWRSEEIWEEWVSNEREGRKNPRLHYFYGIFCFSLVTEWRQVRGMGAKMREREERMVDQIGFSCGNLCFALVTEWRQLRGMGIKWERGKKEPSARVFLWEAQHLILEFSTGSVSTPAEMGCWCGYLEGAISVEKIQKAQSAWIWYEFPHWKIFFIFHKSGFQKPYI